MRTAPLRPTLAVLAVAALASCALKGGPPAEPLPEVALPAPEPAAAAMAKGAFAAYVRAAVLTGPGAAATVARVAEAEAAVEGAARGYRPEIGLSLDMAAEQVSGAGSSGLVPALRIVQAVFDGGARRREAEATEARLSLAEAEQAGALARLALDVIEAVGAVERARAEAALAEADRAGHAELLAGIEARAAAGAGTEGEVLTARGRLAAAEAEEIAARGAARAAQARLDEVAGAVEREPPPLVSAPLLTPVPLAGAATAALAARRAAVAAAEADLARAAAQRLPVTALTVTARKDADEDGETLTAGLGIDHDIDTAGKRRSAVAVAEARLAAARAELDAAERAAARQARQDADALFTAAETAAAAARAVAAERAAFAATVAEVDLGRRPATALLDARRDLTRAERTLVRADTEFRLAGWRALARDGAILSALGLPLPGSAPVAVAAP